FPAITISLWFLIMLLTVACSDYDRKQTELERYVADIKAQPLEAVATIPTYEKYNTPNYSMALQPSPFQVPKDSLVSLPEPLSKTLGLTGITVLDAGEQDSAFQHLSFNFQDVSVRSVLQTLAEVVGINLLVTDSVQGNITLHLQDVSWEHALDLILTSQGLAERKVGDAILIAPALELVDHERQVLEASQQAEEFAPLISDLITLQYANANDVTKLLKSQHTAVLSSRGSVSADVRTNAIWLQDTAGKVAEIRKLISKLDIPVKQVLIEARIVMMDKSYEYDLGIRWGVGKENRVPGVLESANRGRDNVSFNKRYARNVRTLILSVCIIKIRYKKLEISDICIDKYLGPRFNESRQMDVFLYSIFSVLHYED
ncbi:MAG: secretin N-terminal domain-containing protein, partial [Cyanobacteria bacterium P01_C01_bin.69]